MTNRVALTMRWLKRPMLAAVLALAARASAGDHAPPAFPQGTLSLQSYGAYSGGLGAYTNAESAATDVGYYVFDNLSLSLEASGYRAQNSPGRDAWMYGVGGVLRHHLIQFDRLTFFIDAGFGPVEATRRVPDGGTYF